MKSGTPKFSIKFKLYDEVEIVSEFAYLGDRVSASGEFEAAVTAITRCGLAKISECGEMLDGRRLPSKLKGAIYKNYVRPATLYVNEAWRLKESKVGIL